MDSNYNLGGLIARIKTKLDDQEFDTDTIAQFLNDAYFDVVGDEEYQFLEQIYQATTQGSDILPLPRNYQSLFTLTAKNERGVLPLEYMSKEEFLSALKQRLAATDINRVKQDVMPFLHTGHQDLDIWSNDYFLQLADMIVFK